MIVVTGATGQLGSLIVRNLLDRVPAAEVGVSVRDVSRAAELADLGVRVRRGDFAEPASLDAAFEGAATVVVVSGTTLGDDGVAQHRSAVDAAVRVGAQRVLYTSHQAAAPGSLFDPARDHAATEAYLAETGIAFTALRDGFHAATVPHLLGGALGTGELVAPADGPVSWTTHADLAEAAAVLAVAVADDRPTTEAPVLTASAAVDLEEVAAILSALSGRAVRRVVVGDEDYVTRLIGHGVPEGAARMFLGMFRAARAGEFAVTSPVLGQLLGREPQSIETVLRTVIPAGGRETTSV